MNNIPDFTATITWKHTKIGEFPYQAEVNGDHWVIRVNDFPAEPLYTLLINGSAAQDFEDWPENWKK